MLIQAQVVLPKSSVGRGSTSEAPESFFDFLKNRPFCIFDHFCAWNETKLQSIEKEAACCSIKKKANNVKHILLNFLRFPSRSRGGGSGGGSGGGGSGGGGSGGGGGGGDDGVTQTTAVHTWIINRNFGVGNHSWNKSSKVEKKIEAQS